MGGYSPGGIVELGRVLRDFRAELVFDLRTMCGVGLRDVTVPELWDLVSMFLRDTRSWVFAGVNRWDYPVSRDYLAVAAVHDAVWLTNIPSKDRHKFKPYPRPFVAGKRYGGDKSVRRSIADVRAIIRPEGEVSVG